MQEHNTFPGKVYAVTSASGCTVTDNKGRTLGECASGTQLLVVATSDVLYTSAPAHVIETFKGAPVGLMGSGGGTVASPLPADYIAADFIQFDGNDYVSLSDKTVAGDRIVFSTVNQFYDHLTDIQNECKADTPNFFYGLNNGSYRYGLDEAINNTGIEADKNWHKITLSYTPSFTFFRIDGETFEGTFNAESKVLPYGMCIGVALNRVNNKCYSRKRRTSLQINGVLKADLIPGITAAGSVVFYNVATGKTFAGQNKKLRAGLTIPQARKLSKLPDGGGTIKVCLPENYLEDEYVAAAIAEAEAKGWIVDVDKYGEGAAASTFALRRVLVRKTQDAEGNYVDAQGVRYFVEKTQEIIGAEPESLGYEAFRSVESAVAYWELEPYVNPEEELLTEE